MIVSKSRVNGTNNEVSAKITLVHSRNRRVPITMLSQAALGAITIWAAPNTVVSQEPSSKPSPMPPRISARPNVVTRVLRLDRKAPSSTAATPSSGLEQCAAKWAVDAAAAIDAGGADALTVKGDPHRCGSLRLPTCRAATARPANGLGRA